jgi:hypothetical protein
MSLRTSLSESRFPRVDALVVASQSRVNALMIKSGEAFSGTLARG